MASKSASKVKAPKEDVHVLAFPLLLTKYGDEVDCCVDCGCHFNPKDVVHTNFGTVCLDCLNRQG